MTLQQKIRNTVTNIPDFPKSGIMFKDVTPIFYDQILCTEIAEEFARQQVQKPDAVLGIESRGFLFGQMMANKLGVPFVLIRKAGKLPDKTFQVEYELEYGKAKIEMHRNSLKANWKVLIHDDLLATGGTASATAELVKMAGAEVIGFNFVIGLDFLNGSNKLVTYTNNIQCLVHY
jgi:adenine phosphoribosyltransferase